MTKEDLQTKIAKVEKNSFLPEPLKIKRLSQLRAELAAMEKPAEKADEFSYYVEYLNKEKNHKRDKKTFGSYEAAMAWGKENFEKFNPDMIQTEEVEDQPHVPAEKETKSALKAAKTAKGDKKDKPVKKAHSFKGKNIKELNEENCRQLLAEVAERRKSQAKSAKKSRTKPVIEKIAANLAKVGKAAIDSVAVEDIKAAPKKELNKMEKAIKVIKKCLTDLKEIFGSDLESGNTADELKPMLDLYKELKEKYGE